MSLMVSLIDAECHVSDCYADECVFHYYAEYRYAGCHLSYLSFLQIAVFLCYAECPTAYCNL